MANQSVRVRHTETTFCIFGVGFGVSIFGCDDGS
jgi:hypothetical protein